MLTYFLSAKIHTRCCLASICITILLLNFLGCADRDDIERERREQSLGALLAEANEALASAEQAMRDAGVDINFIELGGLESLADLNTVLPAPIDISQLEKQIKMEKGIENFYKVLDILGKAAIPTTPAMPFEEFPIYVEISKTDLALIHFHLAYLYTLDSVSRLTRVAGDLYAIELKEGEVYRFALTQEGEDLINSASKETDPTAIIKIFTEEQRQAVIDTLYLLTGGKVVIQAHPEVGIPRQEPQIDTTLFRSNTYTHLKEALSAAKGIAPEIEEAFGDFEHDITEELSLELLENVREWGFEINLDTLPEELQELLKEVE